MMLMGASCRCLFFGGTAHQPVMDADPLDHEHAILDLNLAFAF